jgi:hypothetical protein
MNQMIDFERKAKDKNFNQFLINLKKMSFPYSEIEKNWRHWAILKKLNIKKTWDFVNPYFIFEISIIKKEKEILKFMIEEKEVNIKKIIDDFCKKPYIQHLSEYLSVCVKFNLFKKEDYLYLFLKFPDVFEILIIKGIIQFTNINH